MDNNDIFKKLRVALQLRDDQIVEIMELVDFRISKAELSAFFRNPDHPNYMECGDQVLRNFLNGLVIHLRGSKENPKDPKTVMRQNSSQIKTQETPKFPKDSGTKTAATGKSKSVAKAKGAGSKKPSPKIDIVEKVRFNNGKNKG